MKIISDGCGIIFGLFLLWVWFSVHWQSALGVIGLFLVWVLFPILFDELTKPKTGLTKELTLPDSSNIKESKTYIVPEFNQYFPSTEMMSDEQLEYYEYWKECWNKRNALNIQKQISYVFCYAYEVISSNENSRIIRELSDLRESYRNEEKLENYLGSWIGDALILEGRYSEALNYEVEINKRLSLKLTLNIALTAIDISKIQKPRVTKHGAKYYEQIFQIAEKKLGLIQLSSKEHILAQFVKAKLEYGKYAFFNGAPRSSNVHNVSIDLSSGGVVHTSKKNMIDRSKSPRLYSFKSSRELIDFSTKIFRDAENHLRKGQGVPLIGEGWISETALYYLVKEAFTHTEVIHHGKPKWLGRQHLDIFIPEFNVGIEYQGKQHQKPVEFFGGEQAFEKTIERDKKKKKLCKINGCELIYVYPDYDFEIVKTQISQALRRL